MDFYGKVIVNGASQANRTITATNIVTGATVTGKTNSKGFCEMFLPSMNRYKIFMEMGGEKTINLAEGGCEYVSLGFSPTSWTWESVKAIIDTGEAEKYITSGDEFAVTLQNTDQTQLVYHAEVNNYGLHEVDFIPDRCYVTMAHHSSDTNAGGYPASGIRTYLNDQFFKILPDDLQEIITEKTVWSSAGSQSARLVTSKDKIWIPNEFEVFGSRSYAAAEESVKCAHYSKVFDSALNRVRNFNGSAVHWWLASPNIGLASYFCVVSAGGNPYGGDDNASCSYGVLPCFRIAPSN